MRRFTVGQRLGGGPGRVLLASLVAVTAAAGLYPASGGAAAATGSGHPAPAPCPPGWTISSMPTLTNTDNAFEGTSALARSDVWAVGYQVEPSQVGVVMTLAEHWDGATWSAVPTPSPSSEDSELHAVAAVTSNDVWAVGVATAHGFDDPRTLIEHWDGSAWSIVTAPSPGTGSDVLLSVTAVSPTDVWAVGYTTPTKGGRRQTLIEHWDGSSWSVDPSPSVTGSDSELLGVSGSPTTGLWAVGFSLNTGSTTALVERWSGTAWSIVSNKAASRANVALTSVVSIGPSTAWAVGYQSTGTSVTAFAARWDGKTWTPAPLPQPGTTVCTLPRRRRRQSGPRHRDRHLLQHRPPQQRQSLQRVLRVLERLGVGRGDRYSGLRGITPVARNSCGRSGQEGHFQFPSPPPQAPATSPRPRDQNCYPRRARWHPRRPPPANQRQRGWRPKCHPPTPTRR